MSGWIRGLIRCGRMGTLKALGRRGKLLRGGEGGRSSRGRAHTQVRPYGAGKARVARGGIVCNS